MNYSESSQQRFEINIVSARSSKTRILGSPPFQSFFLFRKERKLISVYFPIQVSAAGLKVRTLSFLYNDFTDIIDSCELRYIRYLIKYNIYYRRETSVKQLEIKRTSSLLEFKLSICYVDFVYMYKPYNDERIITRYNSR